MENNELQTLRQMLAQAAERCQDPDLLYTLYKVLTYSEETA